MAEKKKKEKKELTDKDKIDLLWRMHNLDQHTRIKEMTGQEWDNLVRRLDDSFRAVDKVLDFQRRLLW